MLFQRLSYVPRRLMKYSRNSTAIASPSSNPVPPATITPPTPTPTTVKGGSSFFQRLTSFCVGLGVGLGTSYYFIYEELRDSNFKLERHINQLEDRLSKVEGTK